MTSQPDPLWRVMLQARFPGTPWRDLRPSADEGEELEEAIKAWADWLVPLETDNTNPYEVSEEEITRRSERQRLRARLLEQARIAREA